MKISAVIVSRNDNYGGHLNERATYCLNSAIDTYDEVFYIDWNSPDHSLLYDIKDNITFKGNLKHIVINPENASILTSHDPEAQKCCEVLSRNIGLRRATGDWLVSTNIDIIAPRRNELEKTINKLDKNSFYTISRRSIDWDKILEFNGGDYNFKNWKNTRDYLIENSEERHFEETVMMGDNYSIINCCGDFQIAHKSLWNEIRGFEEDLIYPGHADTNIQKKAVMHGFDLKALYNPAFFHINHGTGGGGFLDFDKFGQKNSKYQDYYRAIIAQEKTINLDTWGFSSIEIEYEII
jgi:hypothetical protein